MIKEQDCTWTEPGHITRINRKALTDYLMRDGTKDRLINGFMLGGKDDNQRRTEFYYIYAEGNLLNGV